MYSYSDMIFEKLDLSDFPKRIDSLSARLCASIRSPLAVDRFVSNVQVTDIDTPTSTLINIIIGVGNIPMLKYVEKHQLSTKDHHEILPFTLEDFESYTWYSKIYKPKAEKGNLVLDWKNAGVSEFRMENITHQMCYRLPGIGQNDVLYTNTVNESGNGEELETYLYLVSETKKRLKHIRESIIRNKRTLKHIIDSKGTHGNPDYVDPYKKFKVRFLHSIIEFLQKGKCVNHKGRTGETTRYESGFSHNLIENMISVDMNIFTRKIIKDSFYSHNDAVNFKTHESRI